MTYSPDCSAKPRKRLCLIENKPNCVREDNEETTPLHALVLKLCFQRPPYLGGAVQRSNFKKVLLENMIWTYCHIHRGIRHYLKCRKLWIKAVVTR